MSQAGATYPDFTDPLSQDATGEARDPHRSLPRQELAWRLAYSFFFAFALQIASAALALVLLLSFVLAFATREMPSERILQFARSVCSYCHQILRYVCFLERKPPFPFRDWPTTS